MAEDGRHHAEGHRLPEGSGKQQRPATDPIHQRHRHQRAADIHTATDHVGQERIGLGEPGGLPQHRPVVKDNVDPGELYKHGQADPYPDGRMKPPGHWIEYIGHPRLPVVKDRLPDGLDLDRSRSAVGQACQNPLRLPDLARRHEIARRLGDQAQSQQKPDCRHDLHPEHPPPGRKACPEALRRPASQCSQRIVAQEGEQQAKHDRQLLEGHQAAAEPRRRDLRDVGRRKDARRSHGHPSEQPVDHKLE